MTNREAIEILSVIRYSPSVDVFNKLPNSDNIIELNYKGAFDLAIKALEERPQGEWNYFAEEMGGIRMTGECPNCKQRRIIDNFCSNCGADMRGNKE